MFKEVYEASKAQSIYSYTLHISHNNVTINPHFADIIHKLLIPFVKGVSFFILIKTMFKTLQMRDIAVNVTDILREDIRE